MNFCFLHQLVKRPTISTNDRDDVEASSVHVVETFDWVSPGERVSPGENRVKRLQ